MVIMVAVPATPPSCLSPIVGGWPSLLTAVEGMPCVSCLFCLYFVLLILHANRKRLKAAGNPNLAI